MKIRENLACKILAFLLAAAAFTSAIMLGWFQLANYSAIWRPEGHLSDSVLIRQMEYEDSGDIRQLLGYYRRTENGEELSPYSQQVMEELKEELDAANTNLRWQALDRDGKLVYGNTEADPPYTDHLYWTDTTLPVSSRSILCEYAEWQSVAEGIYTAENTPAQHRVEEWQAELAEAADAYENGLYHIDIDTVFMGIDGITEILQVEYEGQTYLYGPTIRSVAETNELGFRYVIGEGWVDFGTGTTPEKEYLELFLWVDEGLPVSDGYKDAWTTLARWKASRDLFLGATIGLAALGLFFTIYLCAAAGHKEGVKGVHLNWFHRIPGDLLLTAAVTAVVLLCVAFYEFGISIYYFGYGFTTLRAAALTAVACAAVVVVLAWLITFCARAKSRTLLRRTLIWMVCAWIWRKIKTLFAAIPLIWKVVLTGAGYLLLSSILLMADGWYYRPISRYWLWLLLTVLVIAYLCWWAWQWTHIRRATEEIIDGNTNCHIDNSKMPPDLRAHADELNNLGEAISAAVDDRMRSEHFKAELITNVSHDLKTPLTSIINYVDLLKKEDIDNPKAQEYIEVLDRKSQRLKKLTEDLVEASKASTGNLTVVRERLDLVQLVDQALAEYQDRLESRRLSIVRTLPAEPVWVLADGRHLWRVIDNLLSNCAKYALEGTRVYAEVRQFFDCAELSIKNISRDALNMDPSLLMERFVRGDESRTMEGSGLGLSIAQSLTDLQQGQFSVSIDGDLFKATVTLPLTDCP